MPEGDDGTLSNADHSVHDFARSHAHLVVVLDCERPLLSSAGASLENVSEVLLRRGAERRISREGSVLTVELADRWMSSRHARLFLDGRTWVLEDSGSKNGTLRNGAACPRGNLAFGDVIEVGHTVLLFRQAFMAPPASAPDDRSGLTTLHEPLAHQLAHLRDVAKWPSVPIMISGETGTGKELVAQAAHQLSERRGRYVAVNCGSIPPTLFEAELFGSMKGAYTGATEDRPGLIRASDGGTLFLDEIAELSPAAQAALLRVLQEREVLPIGATRPVKVDLRVVCATQRDLSVLVDRGQFRADLYSRLAGYRVALPPLRDRLEDLGTIIATLLRRSAPFPGDLTFTPRAARALFRYHWPLNIRELEKCLVTASALVGKGAIDLVHLPEPMRVAHHVTSVSTESSSAEEAQRKDLLTRLLREHEGNVTAVARAMGKAATQIHRWIRRYNLDIASFRPKRSV